MIDLIGKVGERLFVRLLPKASAAAFCMPQTYCQVCGGGGYVGYQRIWIYADCGVGYGSCTHC